MTSGELHEFQGDEEISNVFIPSQNLDVIFFDLAHCEGEYLNGGQQQRELQRFERGRHSSRCRLSSWRGS